MAYEPGAAAPLLPGSVTKVMSELLAPRNYQWQCSRKIPLWTGWASRACSRLPPFKATNVSVEIPKTS